MTVNQSQSRWMEQPLEDERKRLARLSQDELAAELVQLEDWKTEEDVLYVLYTIQEAFLTTEHGVEAYLQVADPFLDVDGVEQLIALFMYEKGERYSFNVALRTASPYLPYGLALKLDEMAQSLSRKKGNARQTDDSSYVKIRETSPMHADEGEWVELYRLGTMEEQFRSIGQIDLRTNPSFVHYIVHDYLTGEDVKEQSVLVIQALLPQLPQNVDLFPVQIYIPSIRVEHVFEDPDQLNRHVARQAMELQAFSDETFKLKRMDPFKALLFMNWYQIVFPNETLKGGDGWQKWLDAVDELTELDFISESPPSDLSEQAEKIYQAVHFVLPEGKQYEQALLL
ncbi:hypothetical protein HNY42_12525 [Exiguobacterium sp. Helios]|uniref:hypothetical protein n=1 Tax=Exiguobacterium sp. Helios TaxID=2735868 RepID=UPI00165E5BCD|nr:hypothetical protein [Exiguobacterium sp. Helios]QNR21727.1 hypothetical protein HNY42_12525 [Exiguobacterium sp. Helios]